MFRHYRVVFRQLVFITSPSYVSISIAAVGNTYINVLKPVSFLQYHHILHSEILDADYIAFVCSVWLSEQTVTFALYIIYRLVFIT